VLKTRRLKETSVESDLDFDAPLEIRGTRKQPKRINSTWSEEIAAGVLVMLDFTAVIVAGLLADVLVIGSDRLKSHLAGALICAISVVQANTLFKLYDLAQAKDLLPMLDRVFTALVVAFGWVAIVAGLLIDAPVAYPSIYKVGLFILSFALISAGRLSFKRFVAKLGERGLLSRNIVVIGAGDLGEVLIDKLERSAGPWTRILCIFDDRANSVVRRTPTSVKGRYPVLGTTRDLVAYSQTVRVDEIFLALPWTAEARINDIVHIVQVVPANIHLCPDVLRHSLINRRLSALDGMPVATMVSKPVSGWGYLTKWILDKTLAVLGLLILSPLLLLIAAAIKLDSAGPVLFRQPRLGFNSKPMMIYKFRSMYHQMSDLSADQLATKDDPRVTRLGRLLRKLSLDELPQLLNVVLGDMSLVGPRPHALKAKAAGHLYHEVVAGYALRHKIKPGITGWAQVSGWRGETDTEEKIIRRVECDIFYMNNWSVLFDLFILVLTVFKTPFHRNAY
jgi:Undecaprenyl-phosphate glucose phosphotransferase